MTAAGDLAMLARVTASLVVVVVLAVLAARLARRAGTRGPGVGLRVIDRTGLSREATIAVVEVAGRGLVLGVTSRGVSVLSQLDPEELAAARVQAGTRPAAPGRGPRSLRVPVPPPTVLYPEEPARAVPEGGRAVAAAAPGQGPAARPARSPAGTGALLDPRTWKQGLDALRDYTVRR